MPSSCVAANCINKKSGDNQLHRFPKDPVQFANWTKFVTQKRAKWSSNDRSVICSDHFTSDCYDLSYDFKTDFGLATQRKRLVKNAVPTVYKQMKMKLARSPSIQRDTTVNHIGRENGRNTSRRGTKEGSYHDFTMATLSLVLDLLLVAVVTASYKKGVALSKTNYQCGDTDAFTNIHWWYDWKQSTWYHRKSNCTNPITLGGRVPMVWGWRNHVDHPLYFRNDTSQYVLGFNEPNHKHQANLSPKEAATAWKQIQARADKQNQLLVGPAAIRCHSDHCNMDGIQWYQEFFQHCSGCRVDYVATHAYWCNADTTMNFLKDLWNAFQKPIWLTEFSCPSSDVSKIEGYMKEMLPRLDRAGYVARYAWYASRVAGHGSAKPESSLLHLDSARLSPLGNYYNNYQ